MAYLRLYQRHPNVESILLHGLPQVLDELIIEQTDGALPALAGIYVGYRLFGFIGMFAGIFTVMVLFDIMKRLGQKDL